MKFNFAVLVTGSSVVNSTAVESSQLFVPCCVSGGQLVYVVRNGQAELALWCVHSAS